MMQSPVLVDKRTESLVLKVGDPFALRDMLPRSKTLDHADFNFAVHHTLDSTKVLRNLGFEVPAPIRHQYDWPGRFTPYEHQIEMAEFLTMHRRCFNLSEMGCVDADTEYLSPTGWMRIASYTGGAVAQYLPDTGSIEFMDAPEFVKLPCAEMIRFQTTRGVDQLLSREHRVLLDDGRVVSAQHVLDQYGKQSMEARSHRFRTTFAAPASAGGVALTDAQIRVQVAANADGWFSRSTRVCVRIKKPRKIERMRALLVGAGIVFNERPAKPEGFVRFAFEAPWTKGFDARWWDATAAQLGVIADEAPLWDGTTRMSGAVEFYGTESDVDFVQYAFASTGRRAAKSELSDCFMVRCASSDPTVGLVSRNTDRQANVRVEPSTDGFKYCFMVPSTFLIFRRNGCIFASGNTMKTNASLWAADWLMKTGRVRKALIISPLSTLSSVWQNDIFETLPHRTCAILHGSKEKRLKYLGIDADFYILNHDGLKINELLAEIMKRPDIDLVIVDEAGMYRNPGAGKYKSLNKLVTGRPDLRLWLMTGTPCPNAPTDAWALSKLVDPTRVPKFAGAFQRDTMMKVSNFKWVARIDAYEKAYQAMQPAIRFKKADCISLPPVVTRDIGAGLTNAQAATVKQLKDHMVTTGANGAKITAANAADQINKMRQVLCIAAGTPVLTDRGWVAIEDVRRADLVWDGEAWAAHEGVIYKGVQPVVSCFGVDMTAGHEVLTVSGWCSAREILNGDARDGLERMPVRLPDSATEGRVLAGIAKRQSQESDLAVPVRLRARGGQAEPKPARGQASEPESLWLPNEANQPAPRNVVQARSQDVVRYEASMREPVRQGLRELWRSRDHGRPDLGGVVRRLLGGYGRRLRTWLDARARGQRPGLLEGELPVGDARAAGLKQANQSLAGHPTRAADADAGSNELRNERTGSLQPTESRVGFGPCFAPADQAVAVYDILNCGPLTRFVVRGHDGGALTVHNCGALKDPASGVYHPIPHAPRYQALKDGIDSASAKVIVVVPFKGIIRLLEAQLTKEGYSCAIVNGDIPMAKRTAIFEAFKKQADPRVLLCHPAVMAHGLNLTEADTLIFYAPVYSNDEVEQVNERFNRAGQTRKMTILRLGSHPLEWAIYKMTDTKRAGQTSILDLYDVARMAA